MPWQLEQRQNAAASASESGLDPTRDPCRGGRQPALDSEGSDDHDESDPSPTRMICIMAFNFKFQLNSVLCYLRNPLTWIPGPGS
jgi:hypothetical protein